MPSIRTVLVCLGLLLAPAAQLAAEDRIFLFSSGVTDISVLSAANLRQVGSIEVGGSAVSVVAPSDRSKYYVIRSSAADTLLVVDPGTFEVTERISLGATASDAVVTPDGRYLLVAAGRVRIFSTATDQEVSPPIDVGGAPTQILVNNGSTRAYVLSGNGRAVHLIDLQSFTRINVLGGNTVGTIGSMALSDDDSRLVLVTTTGLRQYRASDLVSVSLIPWGSLTITRGRLLLARGNDRALVENRGSPPNVTSVVIDLDGTRVEPIGDIAKTRLEQITVLDETTAYAIQAGAGLVKIDFTDPTEPTIELLQPGLTADTLSLSPNGRFLYASSSSDSRVMRIEIETNTITNSEPAAAPPLSHVTLFDPATGPPARLTVNGGNNQSVAPDKTLPVDLSVTAYSADGSPVVGQPILFVADAGVPLQFDPPDLVVTNSRGVAAVRVIVPSVEVLDAARAALVDSGGAVEAGFSGASGPAAAKLQDAGSGKQQSTDEPIQRVTINASAGGATAVGFILNIVRAVGLVKLSGNHQLVGRGEFFPEPLVMLATDLDGNPLPAGTLVHLTSSGWPSPCSPNPVEVDPNGIATVRCFAASTGTTNNAVEGCDIIADVTTAAPELGLVLGKTGFSCNVAIDPAVSVETVSGDLQSAPSGTKLAQPLRFQLRTNGIPVIAKGGIGVSVRQISGPPVSFDRLFVVTTPLSTESVQVTLGPSAGTSVIEVQASARNLPKARFSVTATGGQPQRLVKIGDGQSGRIGNELPTPLQVQVFNETNQMVPFPQVTWTVLEGDATIVPTTTPTGATARVLIGNTPGAIRIQAQAGSLTATFALVATPPQPVSISSVAGQNQTLNTGSLSEPLMVVVNEVNGQPANSVVVTFSGPPTVRLHALQGELSGNPLQLATDNNGTVGVRAELLASAALRASPGQFSNTITITASAGDDLTTTFLLNVIGQTPVFTVNGVLNAASYQPGVVPGGLAAIFGTGLSEGVSGTVFVNGDTSYDGTIVRIGGFQAPLISITGPPDEQINVQVPFELAAGIQTSVQVENNGSSTTIGGVASFASQPGIFTVNLDESTTVGAALNAMTNELITPQNPVGQGEPVSMYITGGGQVNPAVLTGVPAPPGPPPLMVLPVIVGVDNKGSEVLFSGYAPGFIGLYQINFLIPLDASCGLVPLNVRVGNVVSPRTNIAVACPQ